MIRVVVDTNVLVSALNSSTGNEALLPDAIRLRLLSPCFSNEILEDYKEVLQRPKFGFEIDEIQSLLDLVRERGELIRPTRIAPTSPDPDDDKFIACAKSAKAEFLVTGNKRHYHQKWLAGTKLVNARELAQRIADIV